MPIKHKFGKVVKRRVVILQNSAHLLGCQPDRTKRGNPRYFNYYLECYHHFERPYSKLAFTEWIAFREGLKLHKRCPYCEGRLKDRERVEDKDG